MFRFWQSLRTKFTKDLINTFTMKNNQMIDTLTKDILERVSVINKESLQQSPQKRFKDYCDKTNNVAFPVFQKIYNQKLTLINYELNNDLCNALLTSFKEFPSIIRDLHIESCKIKDEDLAIILQGANRLRVLQSLSLTKQDLGLHFLQPMESLLKYAFPNHLQELRIVKCRLSTSDLSQLLSFIEHKSYLRTLVLINASFNNKTVAQFCNIIKEDHFLRNIDISWNELTYFQYMPILEAFAENNLLEEVNLSHNQLFEPGTFQEEDQKIQNLEEKVIKYLKTMLINNQRLTHLFLNECGLTFTILDSIVNFIKYSPSLVAVHLSNNPGIQEQETLVSKLGAHLVSYDDTPNLNFDIDEEGNSPEPLADKEHYLSANARDLIQSRKIVKMKDLMTQHLCTQDPYANLVFMLQRVIGLDQ